MSNEVFNIIFDNLSSEIVISPFNDEVHMHIGTKIGCDVSCTFDGGVIIDNANQSTVKILVDTVNPSGGADIIFKDTEGNKVNLPMKEIDDADIKVHINLKGENINRKKDIDSNTIIAFK